MSDTDDRYTRITLRIPRELHVRLQQAADEASHSQNAEIVQRLEGSFQNNSKIYQDLIDNNRETIAALKDVNHILVRSNQLIETAVLAFIHAHKVGDKKLADTLTEYLAPTVTKSLQEIGVDPSDLEGAIKDVLRKASADRAER